jgi:lysine-specific demethylase/histidyl-hydroxylase NO66
LRTLIIILLHNHVRFLLSFFLSFFSFQGLAPHHDDVEVFILQTEGSKQWKLYSPVGGHELPETHSYDLPPDGLQPLPEPLHEVTLEQGDMLYFPRGIVHQACTGTGVFSTHVTFSTYQQHSWSAFLTQVAVPRLLQTAFETDKRWREGLPVNCLSYMGTGKQAIQGFHQREAMLKKLANKGKHVKQQKQSKAGEHDEDEDKDKNKDAVSASEMHEEKTEVFVSRAMELLQVCSRM